MKQNYEKKYKCVLNTARQWIKDGCSGKERICLECCFPELRESEDEEIRKEIISALEFANEDGVYDKHIAWLEKQKINTEGDFGRGYDCGYKACLNSHGAEFFEKQKEQKHEEWSEKDLQHKSWILECLADGERKMPEYAEDFRAAYKWLKSLHPQPKQEWSKEDEYLMEETIQHLEQLIRIDKAKHCGVDVQYYQRDIDWLKSLRPQPKQEWSEEDSEKRRKIKACICYALANIPNEKIKDFGISLRDCLDYVVPVDKSLREPVDLEKEIENKRRTMLLNLFGPMNGEQGLAIRNFARHFYELGLNARKEE